MRELNTRDKKALENDKNRDRKRRKKEERQTQRQEKFKRWINGVTAYDKDI